VAQLPRQIGPYRIEGRLGAGNMGVVFRVRHVELDACYALKVLRTDLGTANDLARFQREIELVAAASKHPNVVGIHTAAQEQGRIYYVMDLVEGEDLQVRVSRGPLPARQAARYTRDLARALVFLHEKGIVHRDIKPANVLVDGEDQPHLTDFGLARAFTDDQNRLTRTGEMIGTPYYMSPEQTHGQRVGPPADVYALGMLLYTLLAGRPAVAGASTLEVVEQIRQGRHAPLAELAPEAPAVLAELCQRALAMDAAERPTAAALAEALDAFLSGGSGGPSAGQAARRRVALVGALLILLVGLVLAGTLMRGGGGSAPPDARAGLAEAGAMLLESAAALGGGDIKQAEARLQAGRAALDGLDGEGAPAQVFELRARLLAKLGVLACLRGQAVEARQARDDALALIDAHGGSEMRELKRVGLAALRAGLELLDPRPDDDYDAEDALRDLARAREFEPGSGYLLRWRVQAAIAAERPAEAAGELAESEDPSGVPAAERCVVWLAAGDLQRAESLLDEVSDPALVARIHYALGLPALEEEQLERALLHLHAAVEASPEDPRRQEALRLARSAARRAGGWTRGGDPGVLGNAIQREVQVALVVRALDPGFELSRERVDAIYPALGEVGGHLREEMIQLVHDLIQVVPGDVSLYKVFAALVVDWGLPQPARDMALIRRGLKLAEDPADQRQLIEQLAVALYTSQLLAELTELGESVFAEDRDEDLKAFVTGRVADLLRHTGQLDEAAVWLARTRELDPDGSDLVVFDYAYHRVRFERDGQAADRQAGLAKAWEFLEGYGPGSWDDWFVETCTWVSLQEESQGRLGRAARALEILTHFVPEELRWEAHRLALLCQLQPYPTEQVSTGLDRLQTVIESVAQATGSSSDDVADPAARDRLRGQAKALLQLSTRHLQQRAQLGQRGELVQGLLELEASLAEIQQR